MSIRNADKLAKPCPFIVQVVGKNRFLELIEAKLKDLIPQKSLWKTLTGLQMMFRQKVKNHTRVQNPKDTAGTTQKNTRLVRPHL